MLKKCIGVAASSISDTARVSPTVCTLPDNPCLTASPRGDLRQLACGGCGESREEAPFDRAPRVRRQRRALSSSEARERPILSEARLLAGSLDRLLFAWTSRRERCSRARVRSKTRCSSSSSALISKADRFPSSSTVQFLARRRSGYCRFGRMFWAPAASPRWCVEPVPAVALALSSEAAPETASSRDVVSMAKTASSLPTRCAPPSPVPPCSRTPRWYPAR